MILFQPPAKFFRPEFRKKIRLKFGKLFGPLKLARGPAWPHKLRPRLNEFAIADERFSPVHLKSIGPKFNAGSDCQQNCRIKVVFNPKIFAPSPKIDWFNGNFKANRASVDSADDFF